MEASTSAARFAELHRLDALPALLARSDGSQNEAEYIERSGDAFCLPRLSRARLESTANESPLSLESTHLVTGGTGGIGLLTAKTLLVVCATIETVFAVVVQQIHGC